MNRTILTLLCVATLTACGGGGSGGTAGGGGNPISTDTTQQQSQMGTATLGTARLQ